MSSLLGNVTRYPVTFERGEGSWLHDTDGKSYLDFLGGVAVCALGHSHPGLTEAIQKQAAQLLHVSNLFYTPPIVAASEAIVGKLGPGRVYFCNSGTEANEAAIKAVRKQAWRRGETDRVEIVALEGSFHGRTLGSLAATMQDGKREGFGPLPDGFVRAPFDDIEALERAVNERTAAMVIEPIQGEAGIRPLSEAFAQAAAKLCAEHGAALVCDEIQTGMGRTGAWWGFEHLGIKPDVVTLAKALGGGFPIGAMWVSEDYAGSLRPGDHSTTQGGNPLACAAALAVFDAIEHEGLLDNAIKLGEWISLEIADLGSEVRGRGLLIALELGEPKAGVVVEAALGQGLIVNDVTASAIRLAPPLNLSAEEAEEGVRRLRAAVEGVRGSSSAKALRSPDQKSTN